MNHVFTNSKSHLAFRFNFYSRYLFYPAFKNYFSILLIVAALLFSFIRSEAASPTCPGVPYLLVNLSGNADSVYTSPVVARSGQCCGAVAPNKCIEFQVTLDANAEGLKFEIASGPQPQGAMFYYVNCLTPIAVGQPICLAGGNSYKITFCKPGNSNNSYKITSYAKSVFPADTIILVTGVPVTLNITGLNNISFRSVYPGVSGQYNSYLSVVSGSTLSFLADANCPFQVKYEITGTHLSPCNAPVTLIDTLTFTVFPQLTVVIQPDPAVIPVGSTLNITAVAGGGWGPYTYQWYGPDNLAAGNTAVITISVPGIYSVVVCDALCPAMGSVTALINVTQSSCALPLNITISNITSSTALVTWTAIPGVYGYKIKRRLSGTTIWTNTGSYAATPYRKLVDLNENSPYEFILQTICNASFTDTSIWSPVFSFTTMPVCSNPETVSLTALADTFATISWTATENAIKYRVRYRIADSTSWLNKYQSAANPTTRKLTALKKNTPYEVQVLSDCGFIDYSAFSNSIFFTTTGVQKNETHASVTESNPKLVVLPTRNNGHFTISINVKPGTLYYLNIFNILGQKVWGQEIFTDSQQLIRNINLASQLQKGAYFISIVNNNESYCSRFFIE